MVKGHALVAKSGVNVTAGNLPLTGASTVKPGDLLRYTIAATNDGNSALFNVKIRDFIPTHTNFAALGVVTTQTGTLKYSTAGTNGTWSNSLVLPVGSQNQTIYVGIDTNGDGNITAADTYAAGSVTTLTLDVTVNQFTVPAPSVP